MFMSPATDALVRQFKALSDPHRLRVMALCRQGELSVTELTAILGQSQPRVSQHLKQLCAAGLLRRFRDGKRVYYRLPASGSSELRRLIALIPQNDALFDDDIERLRALRSGIAEPDSDADPARRAIHRALIDQTVAAPLGDLLDVGCGRGRILKLLASRANRAIGVDIDADARDVARADLLLAGLPNCSLRHGDMYRLPFDDASFDTIVLDDVLIDAEEPVRVLTEARRLLRPSGRLLILIQLGGNDAEEVAARLADWNSAAGLRVGPPRAVPTADPAWLLATATVAVSADDSVAA